MIRALALIVLAACAVDSDPVYSSCWSRMHDKSGAGVTRWRKYVPGDPCEAEATLEEAEPDFEHDCGCEVEP